MIYGLTSLMFFGVILILTIIEYRRIHNWITPFTVVAWPFVLISLLVNILLVEFGFYSISLRTHFFILANLILIWIVGFFIKFLFSDDCFETQDYKKTFKPYVKFELYVIVLSWIIIAAVFYRVYSLISLYGGWSFIGDFRFEEMMGKGIIAHLIQVAKVFFIYLVFTGFSSKHRVLRFVTQIGLIVAIAAIQVKYHLMWVIIIAFLFHNINKEPRHQIWSIVQVLFLLILLMNAFWIVLTFAWGTFSVGSKGIHLFLLKQSLNYMVSSVIVLDNWLTSPNIMPSWTMIVVFINIFNVLMGNPNMINPAEFTGKGFTETGPGVFANVGTAFGGYYLIGGIVFCLFMTTLLALIIYYVYYKSFTTRNPILVFLNLLFCMLLMLTFFDQYFTLLSLYEMIFLFITMITIFNVINLGLKLPNEPKQLQC